MEQHCTVEHVDGVVMLHPKHGECYINYEEVARPTKLNQGGTMSCLFMFHIQCGLMLKIRATM